MFGFIDISAVVVFRIIVFLICLNHVQLGHANETVFYSKNIFLKPLACEHCSESFKAPVKKMFQSISDSRKILLFINPYCSWCKKAMQDLGSLKRRNPHWSVQVYVMGSIKEFIDYFRAQATSLPQGLDYTLDFQNIFADQYEISQTPTYIIMEHGKTKKVEGYVDLFHFNLDDDN